MADMHRKLTEMVLLENKKLVFNFPVKCTYWVDITRKNIEFYFIVSDYYEELIREKRKAWSRVTVETVDEPTRGLLRACGKI